MRMTDLKERRQRAIADLIRGSTLSSQEELADRLGSLGFAVTQATISRDLEQLGAVLDAARPGDDADLRAADRAGLAERDDRPLLLHLAGGHLVRGEDRDDLVHAVDG